MSLLLTMSPEAFKKLQTREKTQFREPAKLKTSLHASRLAICPERKQACVLKIIAAKLERLQKLTQTDAEAEGYHQWWTFAHDWDRQYIDTPYHWHANPWVFKFKFKTVFLNYL